MPDIDVMRELTGQFERPAFDDLVVIARKRRRRSALVAVTGAVAVVVALGITAAGLSQGHRALEPDRQPSLFPTGTQASVGGWTPERVRAQGSPLGAVFDHRLGHAPGGLDAELYCVGGDGCDDFPPDPEGRTSHFALEITRDGRSVLFDVEGRPWATYFGEDSILVEDGFGQAERFRLLDADGTAMPMRVVGGHATATPGPDVILIQDLHHARNYQVGPDGPGIRPYLVDDRAGTLQPLDVPEAIKTWAPNVQEFLWAGDGCRLTWQQPDGSFAHHDVHCRNPELTDIPGDYWDYLADWAAPGRMVLLEHSADGVPLALDASLDYGATWQRITIPDRNWGETTAEIGPALTVALQELR